jgi:hypothetical protein
MMKELLFEVSNLESEIQTAALSTLFIRHSSSDSAVNDGE